MFDVKTKMKYDGYKLDVFVDHISDFINAFDCEVSSATSHGKECEYEDKLKEQLKFSGDLFSEKENTLLVGSIALTIEGDAKALCKSLNEVLKTCGDELIDTERLTLDFIELIKEEEDRYM